MSSRGENAAIWLAVVAGLTIHALTPQGSLANNLTFLAIMLAASIAAWIGVLRTPSAHRLLPGLVAAGVTLVTVGEMLSASPAHVGANSPVSIADVPWAGNYLILIVALLVVLTRSRDLRRTHTGFVVDAATIVVVSVLIFWRFSADLIIANPDLPPGARALWASYAIAGAVLLALVLRALIDRDSRAMMGGSLALAVCLLLAADSAYLHGTENATALLAMNLTWLLAATFFARAAWRGVRVADRPACTTTEDGWVAPLMIAVGPLLVPPMLEVIADLDGRPLKPLQLFIGTAALLVLAFIRTARLIRTEGRALLEIERARDAALDASKAKSMFLANMSHEIRTPLTTVLATAEILEDTALDDVQRTLVMRMHRSGELLRTLVEGILDFSRIEAGHLDLAATEFDLRAAVAEIGDAYAPRATTTGLQFDLYLDPEVRRMVVGDPARLLQVITNLLDNALKFTHEGTVGLSVRPGPTDAAVAGGVDDIEFVVHDTGIGIRESDQQAVFESFSQVDGSMTRRYGGSGLGLAICAELTELMGGSISLSSEYGVGSTFVVRVPLPLAPHSST